MPTPKPVPPADKLRRLLDYDPATGVLTWKRYAHSTVVGKPAGCKKWASRRKKHGGIYITINGQQYWAHRLIWAMVMGSIPDNMEVDHKDQDPWNNKWDNLRLATRKQNAANQTRNTTKPGMRGVVRLGNGTFQAKIRIGGKAISLGTFTNSRDAHAAYCRAAKEHHGDFACSE